MLTIFSVFMKVCICHELQALAIFNDESSSFNPTSPILTALQNSCKTSYESTQTGNESTQTESFPWLSRPRSQPVQTRGKINQRKTRNASTQGVNELTQSGFPRIESTWESTCSDPKGQGSRKEENESTQGVSESTHSSFLELSRPVVDLFGPEGFAPSHESTHKVETPKNAFLQCITPFFNLFVCNGYFRDGNERKWPIE